MGNSLLPLYNFPTSQGEVLILEGIQITVHLALMLRKQASTAEI